MIIYLFPPAFEKVSLFTPAALVRVLARCPESKYFGSTSHEVKAAYKSVDCMRYDVYKIAAKTMYHRFAGIDEKSARQEESERSQRPKPRKDMVGLHLDEGMAMEEQKKNPQEESKGVGSLYH